MSTLLQDLKFGWRTLRKSPGFTGVALATLAIGIGANTAIFSFVNGILLKPLPYADPARIVRVLERTRGGGRNGVSTLNYLDWKAQNRVFDFMAAVTGDSAALTDVDEPVQLWSTRASARYFDIFGIKAALGRTFVEGDDLPGNDRVVILSWAFWKSKFAADPTVVGRSIQINGQAHTVIGVLPDEPGYNGDIWRPLSFSEGDKSRDYHWMGTYARLKPGITLEQAQAQMTAIGTRIAHDYPASNKGWNVAVDAFADTVVDGSLRQSLYVLWAAVGLVLLIACANLANLTLARGFSREREIAIRASLGAGRWRLLRQFLTESVLLACIGGVLGVALGYAGMAGLRAALPASAFPSGREVVMDGRVLLFTAMVALVTGVVCGLIPALQASRPNLASAAREGGHGASAGAVRHRLRSTLVVVEVAVAFVLLMGAGLVIRSFYELQKVDLGLDPTNVLTAELPVDLGGFSTGAAFAAYLHQVTDAINSVPGVRDVAVTTALPMRGWGYGLAFQVAGRPVVDRTSRPGCFFKIVSPSYFRTLGIPVIQGRGLDVHDVAGAAPVAVIDATLARKYFAGENPIGQRLLVPQLVYGQSRKSDDVPWEVVGVVANERVGRLEGKDEDPGVYVTTDQSPARWQSLVIRTELNPLALRKAILDAIHRVNKDQPLAEVKTIEQIKQEVMGDKRVRSLLLTIFAGVALVLSAIGIYGIISYSVVQRTREIGIRTALGATPGSVLKLILRGGMGLVNLGLVIGIAAALALMQLLGSLLYGVTQRDSLTIGVTVAILGGVALVACWIPARRATKVNPIIALRAE